MCGIAGIIGNANLTQDIVNSVSESIAHRGPDGHGEWSSGQVCLIHRRLSIQDIDGGRQPMSSADGRYIVVYNGEIYNFPQLKTDLEQAGATFQTHCDTEVLLHLYARDGERMVDSLRGMFAFAIWDCEQQTLFLARDHIGQKPLFFFHEEGVFVFASEIKGILASEMVERKLNLETLWHHTSLRFCPDDMTLFAGIKKLLPGQSLMFSLKDDSLTFDKYWELDYTRKSTTSLPDSIEQGYGLIDRVVKEHLLSDVPVGSFLSGGVDSSLIAAMAQQNSPTNLKTFSIGSMDADFSELPYAKEAAELLKTEHFEFRVQSNLMKLLPDIVWHMEEPSDPHAVGLYQLSGLTRQHLKVSLGGDGGDEVFGGYARYTQSKLVKIYSWIPAIIRRKIMAPLIGILPESFGYFSIATKARWVHEMSFLDGAAKHYHAMTFFRFPDSARQALFEPSVQDQIPNRDTLRFISAFYDSGKATDPIDCMLYAEQMSRMPEHYLLIADRMSMAHGLESRVPLVDKDILEFSAALPSSYKIQSGKLKFILREIAGRHYSEEFLYRTKQGFGFPMARWFRDELRPFVEAVISQSEVIGAGIFRREMIETMFEEHVSGKEDHNFRIWMIINIEVWYRMFILAQPRDAIRVWISQSLGEA